MRLPGRLGFLGVALLIGGAPFAQSASAADITVAPEDRFAETFEPADGWTFQVTPYAWIMGLEGSQTIRGRTVDVSASFIDILENSDSLIGLMGYAEARKGRWGIFGDGVYSAITASGGATHDFTGPFGRVKGTLDASLGLDIQMFTGEAGVAYEVLQWGSPAGSLTAIDIMAGGRYWWQEADLDLKLSSKFDLAGLKVVSANRAVAASGDVEWFDPFVGGRIRQQFKPGLEATLAGDVGGFGVGSEFSWQLVAALSWEFAHTRTVDWAAVVGYRALYVDYEQGSVLDKYEYDMLQHGPLLGISARF